MSDQTSIIYKNIFFYRALMNLIYTGSYRERFEKIIETIEKEKPKSVTELCFGDTVIAAWCRSKNISWHGVDINENFVARAIKNGFSAERKDIALIEHMPAGDLFIISGSLYHFNVVQRKNIFEKIFAVADRLIISEPVSNLSSKKGVIGFLARRSANAGKGEEQFRFNPETFIEMLDELKPVLNFTYTRLGYVKKDILVLLKKNGSSKN